MTIDKHNVKLSSSEKAAAKKLKHIQNLALSNPRVAAENKAAADAKRQRRAESGSTKEFK